MNISNHKTSINRRFAWPNTLFFQVFRRVPKPLRRCYHSKTLVLTVYSNWAKEPIFKTLSGEPCADSLLSSPDSSLLCVSKGENKAGQGVN